MSEKLANKISLIIFVIIEALIIFDIVNKTVNEDVVIFSKRSPILFPFLIAVIIGGSLLVYFVRLFLNRKSVTKDLDSHISRESVLLVVGNLAALLLYAFLLPKLHFMATTILYMFLVMVFINDTKDRVGKKFFKAILISVILVPVIYYVFANVFNVVFP